MHCKRADLIHRYTKPGDFIKHTLSTGFTLGEIFGEPDFLLFQLIGKFIHLLLHGAHEVRILGPGFLI